MGLPSHSGFRIEIERDSKGADSGAAETSTLRISISAHDFLRKSIHEEFMTYDPRRTGLPSRPLSDQPISNARR